MSKCRSPTILLSHSLSSFHRISTNVTPMQHLLRSLCLQSQAMPKYGSIDNPARANVESNLTLGLVAMCVGHYIKVSSCTFILVSPKQQSLGHWKNARLPRWYLSSGNSRNRPNIGLCLYGENGRQPKKVLLHRSWFTIYSYGIFGRSLTSHDSARLHPETLEILLLPGFTQPVLRFSRHVNGSSGSASTTIIRFRISRQMEMHSPHLICGSSFSLLLYHSWIRYLELKIFPDLTIQVDCSILRKKFTIISLFHISLNGHESC